MRARGSLVQTCETNDLYCSVYKFLDDLEKPVISRHGSKGGRFIDGMYTCTQGLEKLTGMSVVKDSGIYSDHDLIIHKIDLGIEPFQASKATEEIIDFKKIMNILMHIKRGDDHPSLNDTVFKGADFQMQAQLYDKLQTTVQDPANLFLSRVSNIGNQLIQLDADIIAHTKSSITPADQKAGMLITRTPQDAAIINSTSSEFFQIIDDIRREADLAFKVPIIPSQSINAKKGEIVSEKIMPGVSSSAIPKNLDEAAKRTRSVLQRTNLLAHALTGTQIRNQNKTFKKQGIIKWRASIALNL